LTRQREVDQVYCGISQIFYPYQSYPSSIVDNTVDHDPVSHVEYYTNRPKDEPRLFKESCLSSHRFPGSRVEVSLLTSEGGGVPIRSPVHQDEDEATKKKNIDLVVLKVCINSYQLLLIVFVHLYPLNRIASASAWVKPGRNIYEALALFDIEICKTCFDGVGWFVPDPFRSFAGFTELTFSIENEITCEYIKNITKQVRRNVSQVADEMGVPWSGPWGRALVDIGPNVFGPFALRPSLTLCAKRIALVFCMRTHLVSKAIKQVEQKDSEYRRHLPPLEPIDKHNHIIRHNVRRYLKYIERGISIEGVQELSEANLNTELQKTVLSNLPSLEEVHGSIARVLPDMTIEDCITETRNLSLLLGTPSLLEAVIVDAHHLR
jgi:hypothetical protein